jgi:CHAD domain-containing protein
MSAAVVREVPAHFDRLLERLADAARRIRRGGDPESIHDLRVAVRRLEAGLDLWRDALRPARRRRAKQALRALRRRLGPAREAEVDAEILRAQMLEATPGTAVAATFALDRLDRRVRRRRQRAERECGRGRIERIVRRVRRACRAIPADPISDAGIRTAARARLERREVAARSALASAAGTGDAGELHGARIALKRWRYAEEWLEEAAPGSRAVDHDWLRTAQDALGRLNDLAALCRTLERWERGLNATHPRAAAPLRDLIERLVSERDRERAGLSRFIAGAGSMHAPLVLAARRSRAAER